jgi:hypothetical protein
MIQLYDVISLSAHLHLWDKIINKIKNVINLIMKVIE